MDNNFYKQLIEASETGYAYQKIICDKNGVPNDFEFIEVNSAFYELTGRRDIIGRKMTEIAPAITEKLMERIRSYGEVAMSGVKQEIEYYSETFKRFYRVSVSSPEKYYFICQFNDITKEKTQQDVLLEAAYKFKALFEKGPIAAAYHSIVYDEVGKPKDYYFIDANKPYMELIGINPIGKMATEVFPGIEKDPFDWIGTFGKVAKTGEAVHFEQHLQSTNRYYDCTGFQYKPDYFIATFLEITERKQAENLQMQTKQNYETFFNKIEDFLFVLDEKGVMIHINDTVISQLGYATEELLGESVLMVHPQERLEEAERIIGEMLAGTAEFCPIPIITKSGKQIPVETRVSHGIWNDKPALFGVSKNISSLKLSEEKFSSLFHLNPSACGLSGLDDGKYLEVNEAFYSLFGFDKDEVIGKSATDLGILSKHYTTRHKNLDIQK